MDFYSIETAPVLDRAVSCIPDFISGYSRDIMINRGEFVQCGIQTKGYGLKTSTGSSI